MRCSWVTNILSTGKTSILLNGIQGRWIKCRRGLHQGDPLSPYLFIIVADVLQRLIQRASRNGDLCHPLDASLPCPVLQYADDTLILMRGDVPSMTFLKSLLDDFSAATGLEINFHKSTFVPLHINSETVVAMAAVLGCAVSSFPQTYLGLPLSPHKLKVADYHPLIASFDRYLSGWKARLLSTGGRLTLVNAVLGSLPVYYMSSLLLPKTVIEAIDARRRAFLWTGEEKAHGSRCLLAWERVCQEKANGGLGVKNLQDQNHCLLMKFVHKLHDPSPLPWKLWFRSQVGSTLDVQRDNSFLARIVQEELPRYRALTRVSLGDGKLTSFWSDRWLLGSTLADTFPALFSHCINPHSSVHFVMSTSLAAQFRSRLTRCATEELRLLADCLALVVLRDISDARLLTLDNSSHYTSSAAYRALHQNDMPDPDAYRFWQTRLPTKVKFFGWLLHHDRLNTRASMHYRHIRPLEDSYCEQCTGVLETSAHIFVECPSAVSVWCKIGISVNTENFKMPWLLGCNLGLPDSCQTDVILLLLWHIWKARNELIFDQKHLTTSEVLRRCSTDLYDWSCRYKKHKLQIRAWGDFLRSIL